MAEVLNNDMKKLKEWIDSNRDYVLILISDHGVDSYGVAGYQMHGTSDDGNEGFILIYNPSIEPSNTIIPIDVIDVCPTLALYLKGVDIPANSMGVTRTYFGANTTSLNIKALKQVTLNTRVICSFVRMCCNCQELQQGKDCQWIRVC
jgi:hypothetical protein